MTTQGQSGPGSNGNEEVLHTFPNLICLHTVEWSNSSIWHIGLTGTTTLGHRVDLVVMAIKRYSTFP